MHCSFLCGATRASQHVLGEHCGAGEQQAEATPRQRRGSTATRKGGEAARRVAAGGVATERRGSGGGAGVLRGNRARGCKQHYRAGNGEMATE